MAKCDDLWPGEPSGFVPYFIYAARRVAMVHALAGASITVQCFHVVLLCCCGVAVIFVLLCFLLLFVFAVWYGGIVCSQAALARSKISDQEMAEPSLVDEAMAWWRSMT
jgi:Na+-transporting methylmalonyl-CoA/oxaloacetate decarboxylase gamma subunit